MKETSEVTLWSEENLTMTLGFTNSPILTNLQLL